MCAASSHGRDDVVVLWKAPESTAGRGVDIGADVPAGPDLRVPFTSTIDRSGIPAQQDAEYRVLARRPTTPRIDGVSRRRSTCTPSTRRATKGDHPRPRPMETSRATAPHRAGTKSAPSRRP